MYAFWDIMFGEKSRGVFRGRRKVTESGTIELVVERETIELVVLQF